VSDNPHSYRLDRPLSRDDSDAIARRRRSKNLAMLAVLLGLVVLFYAISMTKLIRG
jgi:hypothetical protein